MNKPVLKVKRTNQASEFELIHQAKLGDVGMDLPAITPVDKYGKHQVITINPGERATIPTGISLEIPDGYWVAIEARSSTSQRCLICPKGVVDTGYRGELFAVLINVGKEPQYVHHGDRLVQIIIHKNEMCNIAGVEEVEELSQTERGSTGFGSSGQSAVRYSGWTGR